MKTFDIEFGGDVMARIVIENNQPKVIACINGWGNKIDLENIVIKEQNETNNPTTTEPS